jgi:hypothetical protein
MRRNRQAPGQGKILRALAAISVGAAVAGVAATDVFADPPTLNDRLSFLLAPMDAFIAAAIAIPIVVGDDLHSHTTTLVIDDPVYRQGGGRLSTTVGTRWDAMPVIAFEITATLERPWHPVCDPITTATFAFLKTDPDGRIYRRPMLNAAEEAAGLGELLVPCVFDTNCSTNQVYAAIDLAEWSADPPSVALDQWIDIVDGTSPDLPGFVFSRRALTFNTKDGYVTDAPFTGEIWAEALYGVQVIPEPATAMLLAVGGLGLLARCKRSQPT